MQRMTLKEAKARADQNRSDAALYPFHSPGCRCEYCAWRFKEVPWTDPRHFITRAAEYLASKRVTQERRGGE